MPGRNARRPDEVRRYFRLPELDGRWILDVIDRQKTSKVWDKRFSIDDDAFAVIEAMMEAHGITGLTEAFP